MRAVDMIAALDAGNYEIARNTSCRCTITWDIDRNGTLYYTATGEDCWVANELSIDGHGLTSHADANVVADRELAADIDGDIDDYLLDSGHGDVVDALAMADAVNDEHEANVREAFADFCRREGYTIYALHPRGFVNEYNLYFVGPGADTSEIPTSAAEIDVDDVVPQYLTSADGTTIADRTSVVVVA